LLCFDLNTNIIKPAVCGHNWKAGWKIGFAISYKAMFFVESMGSRKIRSSP
jgi:hypothetical protein